MITAFVLVMLAQEGKVQCTSIGGPWPIGKQAAQIQMHCCPHGQFIRDVNRPLDKHGQLLCVLEQDT